MKDLKKYQYEDWLLEAKRLFGDNPKQWQFKCCNCGHLQTIQDFIDAKIDSPEGKVYFSCIGRWTDGKGTISNDKSPCNYTIGGLFNIANVCVIDKEGSSRWVFDFAQPEEKEDSHDNT